MKKILLSVLLVLATNQFFAQAFDDGTNLVYVGFGLPPSANVKNTFAPFTNYSDYKYYNYGTVVLKYEHGFHKYFGCGLNMEYSNSSANFKYADVINSTNQYQRKISSNILGTYIRMNGHFPIGDHLDIYGGFGLGYLYTINKYTDSNPAVSTNSQNNSKVLDFNFQATLGARYMIKDGFGLFGEIGYATTICQLGFVFKF
jgi:hypothetical protein